MARVISTSDWQAIDVNADAKNWTHDASNVAVRQTCQSKVVQKLCTAINHIVGRHMRPTFMMSQIPGQVSNGGTNHWTWTYDENVLNARDRSYRILALKREVGNANAQTYVFGSDGWNIGPVTANGAASYPQDLVAFETSKTRGNIIYFVPHIEYANFVEGFKVVDLVEQESQVPLLDESIIAWGGVGYDAANPAMAGPGRPITCNVVSKMSTVFDRHRRTAQPILSSWAARTDNGAYVNVAETNDCGIVVSNAGWVNLLDKSVEARSASSPGISCAAYKAGRGRSNTVDAWFYGRFMVQGGGNGYVSMVGPNGNATLTVTSNECAFISHSNAVTLNTNVADDDTTINRNKLDFMAKADAGNAVFVYGLHAFLKP